MEPRIPNINRHLPEIGEVAGALAKVTGNGSVPSTTLSLMYLRAGQIVGSTYQVIRHSLDLRRAGESPERITSVATWWDAPYFTDPERAALALTEAVFQPGERGRERVPDDLFAEVSKHYDERALSTLIAILGAAGFWMNVGLLQKPRPAVEELKSA